MQGDFDRIRLRAVQLGDLPGREISSVTEPDQLSVAFLEPADRAREDDSAQRIVFQVASVAGLVVLGRYFELCRPAFDAPAGDADQPSDRLALLRVVALLVAQRSLERLARDVLRVGPV